MPRLSAEARAAAAYRAGPKPRDPPAQMSAAAKLIWLEIVADRPADWFRPGAYELLEQYCELTVQQRKCSRALARKAPTADEYPKLLRATARLSATLTTLASKLRLSVQADVDRRSAKSGERGGAESPDPLLGGSAVWGDRPPLKLVHDEGKKVASRGRKPG